MNKKEFIFVLIITFIVVMVWVIADILHSQPQIELKTNIEELLTPVNPTFDQEVLDRIEEQTQTTQRPIASQSAIQEE